MAKVNLSEDMKPKVWIAHNIFLADVTFVGIFTLIMYLFFSSMFKGVFVWIFVLFSIGVGVWIVSKCPINPTRRNWQALFIYITRNNGVYKPLKKSDFKNEDRKEYNGNTKNREVNFGER